MLIRVTGLWGLTCPGEPGKSWNFILTFARTEESWKRLQVLEIPENLLYSSNKVFRINIEEMSVNHKGN